MPHKFQAGDKVQLTVELTFNNPPDLPAGSVGTVTQRINIGLRYRVKFDIRPQSVVVLEQDLQPASGVSRGIKAKKRR